MKYLLLPALIAILLTGCAVGGGSSAGSTNAKAAPRISFSEETYDFGNVQYDQVVEHAFTLKNVGNAPLVLTDQPVARAAEGC